MRARGFETAVTPISPLTPTTPTLARRRTLTPHDSITWLISPRKDDHYTVTFKTPQKLKKVLIMSGAPVGYKGVGDTFQGVELQGCSADGSCTTLIANTQERDLVVCFSGRVALG